MARRKKTYSRKKQKRDLKGLGHTPPKKGNCRDDELPGHKGIECAHKKSKTERDASQQKYISQ